MAKIYRVLSSIAFPYFSQGDIATQDALDGIWPASVTKQTAQDSLRSSRVISGDLRLITDMPTELAGLISERFGRTTISLADVPASAVNHTIQLAKSGLVSGGTVDLSGGPFGAPQTINPNGTAQDMMDVFTVSYPDSVFVQGPAGGPYDITFVNGYGTQDVTAGGTLPFAIDNTNATGGGTIVKASETVGVAGDLPGTPNSAILVCGADKSYYVQIGRPSFVVWKKLDYHS